jgi:ABC-type bacteriocin/lantibiotic exporter with double-glycine peptidase domain
MQTLKPNQRFWRLLKPDQQEIVNVYIYSIFNGLVNLTLPLGIQAIINFIQVGEFSTSWVVLIFLVVLGVAVTGGLQIAQIRIVENLQQKIFTRAAFEFAHRIPKIRMEVLYKHFPPELMNRFFDTITVQKGLSKIIIDFSTATLQVILSLILLSLYHSFFIFFSLLLIIVLYLIIRFTFNQGLDASLEESKHKYKLVHWLEELARTATTFKLAGTTDLPLNKSNAHVFNYLDARERHFTILKRQYILMVVFKVLITFGLLAIGGVLVMERELNLGQFVAAEIIILLVMSSVEKLILCLETIYDVLTGLEKIGQVTDMDLETQEGIDILPECSNRGMEVELNKVNFSYPKAKDPILKNLNLKVPPGQKLMITGKSGAGKSTLLQVVAGLYDVQDGYIAYQGLTKGNINLKSLRNAIGDCLSQEQLFMGTIMENITMGRKEATFQNVQWAIENLELEAFIQSQPKGYDSHIDPKGMRLSGNIVQRLLIARSVVDRPKLLVLEEAFEKFNPEEGKRVIDFLTHPDNGWTLVAVSTNPYLAAKCDRIIWMEDGSIKEDGTYSDMINMINPS